MAASPLVTDKEMGLLAQCVSSDKMYQIGVTCLGLDMDEVEREGAGLRENQWKFNFNVLRFWQRKAKEKATFQVG